MSNINSTKLAIIGLGCRFPGHANSPSEFFDNLLNGRDCIADIPADRWNRAFYADKRKSQPGKMVMDKGGFIDHMFDFDNEAFAMSGKEAAHIDVQQKILLEVCLQALEDSGISYKGSNTGVFIGAGSPDFAAIATSQAYSINEYSAVGSNMAILSNRLSYTFDLRGPSLSIDTACSGSGTAMYLASQALQRGDCDSAVVGGINILLNPAMTVAFSKLGVLGPDCHCKSFDASANGYVRSEGCGIVVIKPLDRAIADGDHVYAVMNATTANQDGAQTPSLTMPSADAQGRVMADALHRAGVVKDEDVNKVAYVEAHATGTLVGDPTEMNTIGRMVGGAHRRVAPLRIGSVKSNIGHTECASYMASLIKCCLMMDKKTLVPSINYSRPNPKIQWDQHALQVQTAVEPFDFTDKYVMISSFGFGGSNISTVLEASPVAAQQQKKQTPKMPYEKQLFLLSARTKAALSARIEQFKALPADQIDQHALAYTINSTYHDADKFVSFGLAPSISAARFTEPTRVSDTRKNVCFVFSGQGPQNFEMGRVLYKAFPVFREVIHRCDALYAKHTGISLLTQVGLFGEFIGPDPAMVNKIHITLPSLIMIQVALFELWKSFGVNPDVIVGHSFGEMCAMYASGAVTLEQVIETTATRAKLMQALDNQGTMIALGCGKEKAYEMIKELGLQQIWIAAFNSPVSVTLGGTHADVKQIGQLAEKHGIFNRQLSVTNAYHTPLLSPLKGSACAAFSETLKMTDIPKIPIVSTVTGKLWVNGFKSDYFWDNIEGAVLFDDAVREVMTHFGSDTVFFEMAPHPVLSTSLKQIGVKDSMYCLHRKEVEVESVLRAAASLYIHGRSVDWSSIIGQPEQGKLLYLPTYPFQRKNAFAENEFMHEARKVTSFKPFIGHSVLHSRNTHQNYVNTTAYPWLADHVVQDAIIFPAAGYIEMALESLGSDLEEVVIHRAMTVPSDNTLNLVQTVQSGDNVEIFSKPEGAKSFSLHASAKKSKPAAFANAAAGLSDVRARCNSELDHSSCYRRFDVMNLKYGKAFQCVESLYQGDEEAIGVLTHDHLDDYSEFILHPAVLDCSFQCFLGALKGSAHTFLPTRLRSMHVYQPKPTAERLYVHCELHEVTDHHIIGDIIAYDSLSADAKVVFIIKGFQCTKVANPKIANPLYKTVYQTKDVPAEIASGAVAQLSTLNASVDNAVNAAVELVDKIDFGTRVIRVLEIGSSKSALAFELLPRLVKYDRAIEYIFAEGSASSFLQDKRVKQFQFVQYKTVDFGKSLAEQGLQENSFDVVLGAQVANTTASNPIVLVDELKQLLVANGLLVLVEPASTAEKPAMPAAEWTGLLGDKGFQQSQALELPQAGSALIVAINGQQQQPRQSGPADAFVWESSDVQQYMAFLQGKIKQENKTPLIVVTQGALLDGKSTDFAAIVGMTRVFANENKDVIVRLVDLTADASAEEKQRFVSLVQRNLGRFELETIVRTGNVFVPRIIQVAEDISSNEPAENEKPVQEVGKGELAYRLESDQPGLLDSLRYRQFTIPTPLPKGHVVVRVKAAPLNFKDVMLAMNMLQLQDKSLGLEFSGIVESVGPDSKFAVGTAVFGFAKNCLGSHVIANQDALAVKPESLSFEEAASIPAVFITSYLALVKKSNIGEGDQVLVHSAAGGVGQASIQLINWKKAVCFATVGSESKRQFLREKYGVSHFANSHQAGWDAEVRKQTAGERGVDVVLNSLSGENITKGLRLLAPYGQFVEIGKRDITENTHIGLAPFLQNLSYHSVHLDMLTDQKPRVVGQLLLEIAQLFDQKILTPIVDKVFSADQIVQAFRYMQQGNHMGKIVVSYGAEHPVKVFAASRVLNADSTYLLAGGLGAVGFEIARWMVFTEGAKNIVLTTRSVRLEKYHQREIARMQREQGAKVLIIKGDVVNQADVDRIYAQIAQEGMPAVRGIINLAMVLDDDMIPKISADRLEKVMKPKVQGTKNLLRPFTSGKDLDFIVLFSSISAVIGNPEQASYAAANTYLDVLAQNLGDKGYRARVINLAAVDDVGVIATDYKLRKIMYSRGLGTAISAQQVCDTVKRIIQSDSVQHMNIIDFKSICEGTPAVASKMQHLIRHDLGSSDDGSNGDDGSSLDDKVKQLVNKIATLLMIDPEGIDHAEKLTSYGVDSLLAVEVASLIGKILRVKVSQMDVLSGLSINALKAKLSA